MGSPISPLIANLFVGEFEVKVLSSAPHPHLWLRYVDDTFVIQEAEHSQQLLQHINTQDPCIQFTMEEPDEDGLLPFLDTLVSPGPNNTLTTTVYRKPLHTDQSLYWDSNHFITAKHSVFNMLAHRAKVVSTNQQTLHKELEHIRKALQACSCPPWTLNKLQHIFNYKHKINNGQSSTVNQPNSSNNSSGTNNSNNNIFIVVPYIQGLWERLKRRCNNKGIQGHFKGPTL